MIGKDLRRKDLKSNMPITSMTAQNKVQTKSVGGAIQTASKDMATTKKSLLTSLECKMLEWANLDIDAAEVVYKDKAEQFEKLMEESEKAYVTLKENKSIDALTERQKAIIQEDIKYFGVDWYTEIIELDKEIIQKLCA